MIDETKLLEWLETHKKLSKNDPIGSDGKYYYAIDFVDLRAEIRRLRGGADEQEVIPSTETSDKH